MTRVFGEMGFPKWGITPLPQWCSSEWSSQSASSSHCHRTGMHFPFVQENCDILQ